MSFVTVQFPRCSICLENFGPDREVIAHIGGEAHPFHKNCFQVFIEAASQPDPDFGIQPIKCPVCKIDLSEALAKNPLQNPSPSVRAASNQLNQTVSDPEPHRISPSPDRYPDDAEIPREVMIEKTKELYAEGRMSEAAFTNYMEFFGIDSAEIQRILLQEM